ncbi:MAG: type II secretion system protein GspM [Geminicoccaceae bacterium]
MSLLLLIILGSVLFVVQPLVQAYQSKSAKISTLASLLHQHEILIGERQSMMERLQATEDPLLQHANDTIAAVALQDQVSSIVDKHGGDIRSVRILPSVDVDDGPGFRKTEVGIQFSADLAVLARALRDLEMAEPVLFVDRMQVTAIKSRDDDIEQLDALKLDIRIDVFTFVRRSDAEATR